MDVFSTELGIWLSFVKSLELYQNVSVGFIITSISFPEFEFEALRKERKLYCTFVKLRHISQNVVSLYIYLFILRATVNGRICCLTKKIMETFFSKLLLYNEGETELLALHLTKQNLWYIMTKYFSSAICMNHARSAKLYFLPIFFR
jgi:hypothetical protein